LAALVFALLASQIVEDLRSKDGGRKRKGYAVFVLYHIMEGTGVEPKGKEKETAGSATPDIHGAESSASQVWTGGMVSGRPRSGLKLGEEVPRTAPLAPNYQNLTSGINQSVWFERGLAAPEFPMLTSDNECDICIVGGGIAGVTSAYLLAKKVRFIIFKL